MRQMMRWATSAILCTTFTASIARAAPRASAAPPLVRARLYEMGVAYYERRGLVHAGAIELPVPAGHLDDTLSSLVVLAPDGKATVSSIEFPSRVTRELARALTGMSAQTTSAPELDELLRAVTGTRVEVRSKASTAVGRLLEVRAPDARAIAKTCGDPPNAESGDDKHPIDDDAARIACAEKLAGALVVLTDAGEFREIARSDVTGVAILDSNARARIEGAMGVLYEHGARSSQSVNVTAASDGPVTLGYIAEAPSWRTSYRLLLGEADALLQGWALVHNDTDEAWKGVQVEIANGQPDSFLYPLAAPRYAQRPLITPDDDATTVPQLTARTVDDIATGDVVGSFGFGSGSAGGYGSGHGRIAASHATASPTSSSLLDIGNLAASADAQGVEAGALFTYAIAQPVDLSAHGSSLLPFIRSPITAVRIARFEKPGESATSAVHVTNSSDRTLPAGPIAVFSDGGFAGQTMLQRLKPRQSEVLTYGTDLDVDLGLDSERMTDTARRVTFADGVVYEHFIRRHELTYTLTNRSASGRRAYLPLHYVKNARLSGDATLEYDSTASQAFAAFLIEPRSALTAHVVVEEGLSQKHDAAALTRRAVARLAGAPGIPAAERAILTQVSKEFAQADDIETRLGNLRTWIKVENTWVSTSRNDIAALGARGGSDAERLVARLLAAEQRLRRLLDRAGHLEGELRTVRSAARARLAALPPNS